MDRFNEVINTVTIATAVASSDKIPYQNFSGGEVYVPAGSAIVALAWYGSHDGVTYLTVYDGFANAVTSTVAAGQCVPIPEECFGCAFLKAVDATGGTVAVSLKA